VCYKPARRDSGLILPENHLQFAGCGIGGNLVLQQLDIGTVHHRQQRLPQTESRLSLVFNWFHHIGEDLRPAADLGPIRIDMTTARSLQVGAAARLGQDQAPARLPADQCRLRTVKKITLTYFERGFVVDPMGL